MPSITDILNQNRIPYQEAGHEHVTRNFVGIDCPYCGDQNQFHLGINLDGKYAVCWRCGPHRLGDVLMQLTREPWPVVKEWLESVSRGQARPSTGVKTQGRLIMPSGIGPLQRPHKRFLGERGFDPDELVRFWGIQGIGLASKHAWSIWIPIHHGGEVASWTTRTIGTRGGAKYVSAGLLEESVHHKTILYGADFAGPSIIVVEGPTDVWAIGPGTVATLGVKYTKWQVMAIGKYPHRTICFDSEPVAQQQARRLALELQAFPGQTDVVQLETGNDPAEADSEELDELRLYLN